MGASRRGRQAGRADRPPARRAFALTIGLAASGLAGCVSDGGSPTVQASVDPGERECLLRAMYFESNRSSYDGMMAVGTVVMNRKESGLFPSTVCGVVGQPRQFAPGALSRRVSPRESAVAERAADDIMAGKRLGNMKNVMYFHTAGLHFPYPNMHYRLVAGGNAFYERYLRHPRPDAGIAVAAEAPAGQTTVVQASPAQLTPAAQPVLAYAAAPPDAARPAAGPPSSLAALLSSAPPGGRAAAAVGPVASPATAADASTGERPSALTLLLANAASGNDAATPAAGPAAPPRGSPTQSQADPQAVSPPATDSEAKRAAPGNAAIEYIR